MPRKSTKIEKQCQECEKTYFISPSKADKSKFCSRECRVNNSRVHTAKANCLSCNKEFIVKRNKKYCSRECYNKEVKNEVLQIKCQNCGKEYEKPKNRATKYCNKTCQHIAQSSGLAEVPSNGRMGFRHDLNSNYFFKSSLEADYARWCEATGKSYIYEHKTFTVQYKGKDKQYTPDFYHPDEDRYVETKAIRRDRKFNSNLLAADILKAQGVNIDVLLMHEFYTQIKQSGHYWLIDNIENKNYNGTKHLIYLKKKV
jgi:hypothetical protein